MNRRISRDFTWEEMTYSRVAVENGLRNVPPAEAEIAMKHLVKRLLQPLRIAYAGPIAITSGYRSPEVNRLVGGVPSSQHVKGEAADCYVPDPEVLLNVLRFCKLPFDQAILYKRKKFLHLSLKVSGKNRYQIIINK
ncbi:D-Ala-D-Ala carboxypeptidase family metallohydrolase [Parabacteroides timonensis]|uniref:D-Ala-D-Ala carboxypeptidase family metallohydrolase n=1 Tax=Parabacteroides timonensis TaxID=1871013 RepID=UPI00094EDEE1|nr:D-Ala-D-Ala carboxypeptidase family metallohydrolase [Parabacteroides timonensis]